METNQPKTPSPRVIDGQNGTTQIIPASHINGISPESLRECQAKTLEYIDGLRQRCLDGQLIGIGAATVEYVDGYVSIGTGWSEGFTMEGMAGIAAISVLNSRFIAEWDAISVEVGQ